MKRDPDPKRTSCAFLLISRQFKDALITLLMIFLVEIFQTKTQLHRANQSQTSNPKILPNVCMYPDSKMLKLSPSHADYVNGLSVMW